MIPGPFSYHRPATLADAVNLLSTLGDEARPLAGGHSLVPMMKLRLASPEHLVDLHGVAGLKGIRRDGDTIVIGAMTTQHELLASEDIGKSLPILHETALLIADPQVRYRGTIGGNVANGDPGNDMPALMMTLGASYRLEGKSGAREVAATRVLPGRLFHRARARRDPDRDLHPRTRRRSRLRLRETEAQGRRLRHRGCRGRADDGGRQGRHLHDRPDQPFGNAAAGRGRRQGRDRHQPRSGDAEEGCRRCGSDHVAGRGCARPVEYRKHVGGIMVMRALQRAAGRASLGEGQQWQRLTSP